jgi:hypothetical protein
MPMKEPGDWLSVAIRVVLDGRSLLAPAILARVLLNRQCPLPRELRTFRAYNYSPSVLRTAPEEVNTQRREV